MAHRYRSGASDGVTTIFASVLHESRQRLRLQRLCRAHTEDIEARGGLQREGCTALERRAVRWQVNHQLAVLHAEVDRAKLDDGVRLRWRVSSGL